MKTATEIQQENSSWLRIQQLPQIDKEIYMAGVNLENLIENYPRIIEESRNELKRLIELKGKQQQEIFNHKEERK